MNELAIVKHSPPMSNEMIAKISQLTTELRKLPQIDLNTENLIHAGTYARTITIPKGTVATGVLIVVPTIMIVQGDITLFFDGGDERLTGYHVFAMPPHRKSVGIAHEDTHVTMIFATNARTVAEAEAEFTTETDLLLDRAKGD